MKRDRKTLNDFIYKLSTKDNKEKMTVGAQLINHLSDRESLLDCDDLGILVHAMVAWLRCSSRIVLECALDILILVTERMPVQLKTYIGVAFGTIADRLGDNKVTVRDRAKLLIHTLMEKDVITPQNTIERLTVAFTYKSGRIRVEVLNCIQTIVSEFNEQQLGVTKYVDNILKLLNDPAHNVRDAAINTFIAIYRKVGDKLRLDLQTKYNVNPEKLQLLMSKFGEVQLPVRTSKSDEIKSTDSKYDSSKSSANFESVCEKGTSAINTLMRPNYVHSEQVILVNEHDVLKSFENIPTINVTSVHDLETLMNKIRTIIENSNEDWNKRVQYLKKLRALVKAGWAKQDEFINEIKMMVTSFEIAVRDLRSQVVRETCYTICYLTQECGLKLDHFSEVILVSLINLIQNSVKVIASAALVTIIFILKNVQHVKLIPIILGSLNSKSKEIRRACYEFIEFVLEHWSSTDTDRYSGDFQEAIKKGIADADAGARSYARKAFKVFESRFPINATHLVESLDYSHRKMLIENLSGSLHRNARQTRSRFNYSDDGERTDQDDVASVKRRSCSVSCVRLSSSTNIQSHRGKRELAQMFGHRPAVQKFGPLSRPSTPSRRDVDVQRRSASFPGVSKTIPRRISPAQRGRAYEKSVQSDTEDEVGAHKSQSRTTVISNTSGRCSVHRASDVGKGVSKIMSLNNTRAGIQKATCKKTLNDETSGSRTERKSSEGSINNSLVVTGIITKIKNPNWFVRKYGLTSLQSYLLKGYRLNYEELEQVTDQFCNMFADENTRSLCVFLDALNELILSHCDDLEKWASDILCNLFDKLCSVILSTLRDKIHETLSIISRSLPPEVQVISVFQYLNCLTYTPDSKCQVVIMEHLIQTLSRINADCFTAPTDAIIPALVKLIGWNHTAKSRNVMEISGIAIKIILEVSLSHINLILSTLPLEYRETVFMFMSGNCIRKSRTKSKSLYRSPSTPQSCPQLQSATTNCNLFKRLEGTIPVDGKCDLSNEGNDASYSGRTFRRLKSENNLGTNASINERKCSAEREQLLSAVETLKINIKGSPRKSLQESKSAVAQIKALVNGDSYSVVADEFRSVLKVLLCLLNAVDNGLKIDVLGVFTDMFNNECLCRHFANYTELMVLRVLNSYVDRDKKVAIAADSCARAMGANGSAEQLIYVLCPLIKMGNFPMNYSAIKMLTKVIENKPRKVIRKHLHEVMKVLLAEYDDDEVTVRKATVECIVSVSAVVGKQTIQPYLEPIKETKLKLLNFFIDEHTDAIK